MQRFTDEFETTTESTPLLEELCERIAREGSLTFEAFMQAALYHPEHGYYRTEASRTGRRGDFVTSPEAHPVFGALVAKQLHQMWDVMSRPGRFSIVEPGAGRGFLARDIIRWARRRDGAFADAIRYTIVEPIPALASVQARTMSDAAIDNGVEWRDALPREIDGCVVSNEVLDAFPVHRVLRRGDDLFEVHVVCAGGRLRDEVVPLSDERIAAYFERAGVLPGDGCFAEVNLRAAEWIADVGAALRHGYVLTFDYGYEAEQLYAPWRRDGTLLCFYRHAAGSDPYQRVGKQDITSSVDFTTLHIAGRAAGLRFGALTDQAAFLTNLGIHAGLAEQGDEMEEYFARRQAVMTLIDPGKLGRIKVLLQSKDVPDVPLWGFSGG